MPGGNRRDHIEQLAEAHVRPLLTQRIRTWNRSTMTANLHRNSGMGPEAIGDALISACVNGAVRIGEAREERRLNPHFEPRPPVQVKEFAAEAGLDARADDEHAVVFNQDLALLPMLLIGEILGSSPTPPLTLQHVEPTVISLFRGHEQARNQLPYMWHLPNVGGVSQILALVTHGTMYGQPVWMPSGWRPILRPEKRGGVTDEQVLTAASIGLIEDLKRAADQLRVEHSNPVGYRQLLWAPVLFTEYVFGFPRRSRPKPVPLTHRLTPGMSQHLVAAGQVECEFPAFRVYSDDAAPGCEEAASGDLMLSEHTTRLRPTEQLKDIANALADVSRDSDRAEAIRHQFGLEPAGDLLEASETVEWLHLRAAAAVTGPDGASTVRIFFRICRYPSEVSVWAVPARKRMSLPLLAIERRMSAQARESLERCVNRGYRDSACSCLRARANRRMRTNTGIEGLTQAAYILNLMHETSLE